MDYPPNMSHGDKVILFDGVCKLCNAWSNFIITHDRQQHFILCSVQSVEGQKILEYFHFPTQFFETMLYVEDNKHYQKSDAFFKIIYQLGYPWRALCFFKLLPKRLRDWLYDRIALNRYRLFGKYNSCRLPTADHDSRYLNEK